MCYQTICRALSCLLHPKGSFTWSKDHKNCDCLAWMQIPILIIGKTQRFLNHSQNNFSCCISKVLGRTVTTGVSSCVFSPFFLLTFYFFFCFLRGLVKTFIDTGFHVGRRNISHSYTISIPLVATYY